VRGRHDAGEKEHFPVSQCSKESFSLEGMPCDKHMRLIKAWTHLDLRSLNDKVVKSFSGNVFRIHQGPLERSFPRMVACRAVRSCGQ
jgi:hypothetical protein